jgi:hypothetical protein
MTELARWANFFVIVGSSAGALIGLQFVVITLVAAMPRTPGQEHAGRTYATPTIVHFGTVLLLSGSLSAPWREIVGPAILCGILGVGGVVYSSRVAWRMRIQTLYRPEFEDWLCHAAMPLLAYAVLTVSAYFSMVQTHSAMFGVAFAAVALLFAGIHNAWDGVTYHIWVKKNETDSDD